MGWCVRGAATVRSRAPRRSTTRQYAALVGPSAPDPEDGDVVSDDQGIRGDDRDVELARLRDEGAIERIAVVPREATGIEGVHVVDRDRHDAGGADATGLPPRKMTISVPASTSRRSLGSWVLASWTPTSRMGQSFTIEPTKSRTTSARAQRPGVMNPGSQPSPLRHPMPQPQHRVLRIVAEAAADEVVAAHGARGRFHFTQDPDELDRRLASHPDTCATRPSSSPRTPASPSRSTRSAAPAGSPTATPGARRPTPRR